MDDTDTVATPRQRKARRLDRQRVADLAERGLPQADIATLTDCSQSQISKFLAQIKPDLYSLDKFKSNRADILAAMHGLGLKVKRRLLEHFDTILHDDALISELTANEKTSILRAVNESAGTDYDKERLERGESTSNLGVMAKVIHEVHGSGVFKRSGKQARIENAGTPKEINVLEPVVSDNGDYDNSVDMSNTDKPNE